MMIPKLPPSIQNLMFLMLGIALGTYSGYMYAMAKVEAKSSENRLNVIIKDQTAEKVINKETDRILSKIRKENAENKDFNCSDAILPDDGVFELEREIDNARKRSDSSVFNKIIDKASNF